MDINKGCAVELYHSFMDVPCWLKNVLIWANHHQGIIGAVFAICAAWAAYKQINRQLKQVEEHRREDLEAVKKSQLEAFSYKVMSYVDSISRMHRHINNIKSDHPTFEDKELWRVFQPIVPDGVELPSLNANDVAILSELGEVEKFSGAARLQRSAKSIEGTIALYISLRQEWSDKSSEHTKFDISSSKTAGETEFYLKEKPHLVRLIGEQSNLIANLATFVAEAENFGIQYSSDIAPMLKKYRVFRFFIPNERVVTN